MSSEVIKAAITDEKPIAFQTFDGFDNFVSRVGLQNNNTLSAGMYTFNLVTRNRVQLEAAYRGSWVVGQVVEVIAEDMTKAGIDITTNEQDNEIVEFQKYIKAKSIWTSIASLIKWGRLYGGAIAVFQISGQDLTSPLNVNSIAKGQFKGLAVYDRWQLNPVLDQVITEGADIGLPKYYDLVTTASTQNPIGTSAATVSGQLRIHHSRIIRNIGIELPFFQSINEQFWGESVLERMWDRLISYDTATMSSANLIERANNRTVGIQGFRQIIGAGGKALEGLSKMFDMMREFQTNEGLTLIDKDDSFASTSYSFAGLDSLLLQFGQQLSGASGIPLVRLLGQSPAGLSATGDSDMRIYYDNINSQQNAKLKLDTLLIVMWASCFGKPAPQDLSYTFVPLWQMSLLDKANIAKTNTETVLGAEEQGLISPAVAMKELRGLSGDTGLFSNITDEDVNKASQEPAPTPENMDDPNVTDPDKKEVVPQVDNKPNLTSRLKSWVIRK